MILNAATLADVAAGRISCVFRWWRRPTVRAGGTLRTAVGVLAIDAVDPVTPDQVTDADAHAAGYATLADALATLAAHPKADQPGRRLYRIRLWLAGPDPRLALRAQEQLGESDLATLRGRLDKLDGASRHGPWTAATLTLIGERPETLAAELADTLGKDKAQFKANVRKLKELGLTESLLRGYRLSPRGHAFLAHLRSP